MIAPAEQLTDSIHALLTEGVAAYGLPAVFPPDGGIAVYRGDTMVETPIPHVAIYQAGPAKERHVQGSGLWEIPMGAKLILDRNGDAINQSAEDVAADMRTLSGDMEAVLTMALLVDSGDPEGASSTPEQRLTTATLHAWEVYDVEVSADTEAEGDPSCEVNFTVFCGHAGQVIY
jgi:hypothetical protein